MLAARFVSVHAVLVLEAELIEFFGVDCRVVAVVLTSMASSPSFVWGVEHAHVLGSCIQACGRLGMHVGQRFDDERLGGLLSSVGWGWWWSKW